MTERWLAKTPPKSRVRELHSGKLLGPGSGKEFLGVGKGLEDYLTQHCEFIIIIIIIFFFFKFLENLRPRG